MMKSVAYHGPGCTNWTTAKRISALVQRAYSVSSGHTRVLGCTDYAETENCCVNLSHLCAGTGSWGIEGAGSAKVLPKQLKR
jgi:hypothetical protein